VSGEVDVLVVGRGAAGALAALAARSAGASVQLVAAGGGATELGSGAWDVAGSQRLGPEAEQPLCTHAASAVEGTAGLVALAWCAEQLGLALHAEGPMPLLATEAGRLRRAAAHDPALLDLSRLPRATVAVASLCGHPSFDADWIARRLDAHALAQDRRFASVELDFVRRGRDRLLHPAELAALLDEDPSARAALARAIVRGLGGLSFDAVLVPPMLGLDAPLRADLEEAVGLPIGEIVSGPGAVAGLRLVRQLARRLEAAGVLVHAGRVETVERAGRFVRVRTDDVELRAERLVLATGGHLGGGVDVDAVAGGARLLGLARVEIEADGRVRGLSGPLERARVHACGEVAGLTAEAGLLAVAASALRAGFSAAT
jgi:glycerol-3-phosphate dehydrogenase subunit B